VTLLLGVDGGNSKTVVLLATAQGEVVGAARHLGCADVYSAPSEAHAVRVVVGAVQEALQAARATAADVGTAAFSMAGADWPEDMAFLSPALREGLALAAPPTVVNDGVGALEGAVPDGPAVVVTVGSGAATAARGLRGETWHSSWWQEPQGAHELARRVLAAVYRAELGIDPPTGLRARVLDVVGESDVPTVLHRFTARRQPRPPVVAGLVRGLMDEAQRGDPGAAAIVEEHGRALGRTAAAAARQVGIAGSPFDLAFAGGLVRAGADPLLRPATEALLAEAPEARPVEARWDPVVGALLLAMREAGVRTPATIERMDASLPRALLGPGSEVNGPV
jgi:N-acetylglucosamine kinase-like BadF-type ATPase